MLLAGLPVDPMEIVWRRLKQLIQVVVFSAGALLLVVTFTPLVPWMAKLLIVNWTDSDGDVLVVLNGGVVSDPHYPNGMLVGDTTYWRAVHAVYAWRAGHFHRVVLVGEYSRQTLQPFLRAYGVPEDAMVFEERSHSTHENAVLAKPILASMPGRKVLLTSDYHMYRAWHCFRQERIDVTPRPFPDVLKRAQSPAFRWQEFLLLLEEFVKIGYYRLHHWV